MTKQGEDLIRKLKDLTRPPMIIEPAVVKLVDEEELTCVVELVDETEIPDVRLKAAIDGITDGLVQIPMVNSTVLVAIIGNSINTRFVIAFSQVEKVIFFEGSNDGLTKINPLVQKLNALENKVNDLITFINSHSHAGNGAPPTPTYAGGTLTATEKEDLEDTKVLH